MSHDEGKESNLGGNLSIGQASYSSRQQVWHATEPTSFSMLPISYSTSLKCASSQSLKASADSPDICCEMGWEAGTLFKAGPISCLLSPSRDNTVLDLRDCPLLILQSEPL